MQFRLLGQLEARSSDGKPATLGAAKLRSLLAVLLLHANQPVTSDRLIDVLWPAGPPKSARSLIRTYTSTIRGALCADHRAGGATSLASVPGGYRLEVPANELDLLIFADLAERGRHAAAAGDLPLAAERLRAALALWRGPVAEGIALDDPALAVVADYEQRRLAAQEAWAETQLALGHHGTLIGELTTLVAANPLRERLAEHLMLGLYRDGRHAEALTVYADVRRHLVDELGVEPGPRLRRLHGEILNPPDPREERPGEAQPGHRSRPEPARPVPRQLPPPARHFTGRRAELTTLTRLAEEAAGPGGVAAVASIEGMAGTGKTTLAVHWAHREAERFPDGQLYVDLRGFDASGSPMAPDEAVRGFLDAFQIASASIPAGLDAQVALYRSVLAGRRVLVVLDNARDPAQVVPLLPGSPGCLTVVTSRNHLTGLVAAGGAQPVVLDLFTVAEARRMLARCLGEHRVAAEPEAADAIIGTSARLPLALAIVAARARTHPAFPLATLAEELAGVPGDLGVLDGGDPATDLRTVFFWSYRALRDPAARLFRHLALHPGPDISVPAAACLAGRPVGEIRPLLAELARANLVAEHSPARFAFHDLLRAYAAELGRGIDSEAERTAAERRMLDYYLHTADAADRALGPKRDRIALTGSAPGPAPVTFATREQALAWFVAERPALVGLVERAAAAGFDNHAWQLAWTLENYLLRRGRWRELAAVADAGLDAATRLAAPSAQALTHCGLGRALAMLGRHDEARRHLDRALRLYQNLRDGTGAARCHLNLAGTLADQGDRPEALRHARRALDLYRLAGRPIELARALNNVGWLLALLGREPAALKYCRQALALHEQEGDRLGQATTWDSLGFIHQHLDDWRRAVSCYQHALDLFRALGDPFTEATTFTHLGDAYRAVGDIDSARHAWRQAYTLLDSLGHPSAAAIRGKLEDLDDVGPPAEPAV